jgi:hypothetical protein
VKEVNAIVTSTDPCKYDDTCWFTTCKYKHSTKSGLSLKGESLLARAKSKFQRKQRPQKQKNDSKGAKINLGEEEK